MCRKCGIRANIEYKRTVKPVNMLNNENPVSEQNDPFYAEYLEMESRILDMITQIESGLSSRVLGEQDDHAANEAVRAVVQARITIGKADAAVRGQLLVGDTDWCFESTLRDLTAVLLNLNLD